jgi:hypothetical protein
MRTSEQIDQLAAALAAAQGGIVAADKEGRNPHLGNRYTTLSAVWDAIREPLSKNGLAVAQVVGYDEQGMVLYTRLMHSSGQYIEAIYPVSASDGKGINSAQALGSALTYARRYSLTALVGVVSDEDDDGNEATKPGERRQPQPSRQQRQPATPPPPAGNGHTDQPGGPATTAHSGMPFRPTIQGAVDWAMKEAPKVWPVDNSNLIVRQAVENSFRKLIDDGLAGDALMHAWIDKVRQKQADYDAAMESGDLFTTGQAGSVEQ